MVNSLRRIPRATGLAVILFLTTVIIAQAQSKINKYDIVLAGFTIGSMQADKVTAGTTVDYQIHSKVEFWFFGKIHVEFLQKAHFEKNYFISSKTNSDSNRGNFITTVEWKEDHYEVDANSYKFHNEEDIRPKYAESVATLYFHEPKDGDTFISENFGMPTTLHEIEKGVYKLEVNGSVNRFYYENGILQKVVLENKIKDYMIRLAED